jgi:hypothetical protein
LGVTWAAAGVLGCSPSLSTNQKCASVFFAEQQRHRTQDRYAGYSTSLSNYDYLRVLWFLDRSEGNREQNVLEMRQRYEEGFRDDADIGLSVADCDAMIPQQDQSEMRNAAMLATFPRR